MLTLYPGWTPPLGRFHPRLAPTPNLLLSYSLAAQGAGEQQGRSWEPAWNRHLRRVVRGGFVFIYCAWGSNIEFEPTFNLSGIRG